MILAFILRNKVGQGSKLRKSSQIITFSCKESPKLKNVAFLSASCYMMYMHHENEMTAIILPCACTTIKKASRAITRLYDGSLSVVGLTSTQLSILRRLFRAGPDGKPLSRLAEDLVMDRTSLYRTLTPMKQAGWIVIENAISGRAKLAKLSNEGTQIVERATRQWESVQTSFIETFGFERWKELTEMMSEFTEHAISLERSLPK